MEVFFMMIVLKIPIVYLFGVVWWAVRAEPRPFDGAVLPVEPPPAPCPWHRTRRRPGPGGRSPRTVAARRSRVSP